MMGIGSVIITIFSLSIGEMSIPFDKIPGILLHGKGSMEYTILKEIRLPRIYLGLSVGGSLSLAGVILQGIYRNPLVEPYTMGISGGAALGVAFVIVTGFHVMLGSFMLPVAGFIGALITVFIVYFLSIRRGTLLTQNMVLIGIMISFIAASGMMFLLATTTNENMHGILFWIMGSLDESNQMLVDISVISSILGLVLSYLFIHPMNALRLGEEKARNLGINTDVTIRMMFLIASVLTGICVSVAGIICFVGLIIPQLIRMMVGSDYRILFITSFLAGGGFLVICDTVARRITAPNELPIGVITGILGGIVFIIILNRLDKKSKMM
jgi:iron complex transport system permease protein